MRRLNKYVLFSLVIVLGVVIDQVSKVWAQNSFMNAPRTIVHDMSVVESYLGGFFNFTYVENDGAFLSLGSSLPPTLKLILLTILPGLVLIGLMVYLLRSNTLSILENIAFALIAAGGIGNIIDRVLAGEVIDFMIMHAFGWHTGIFNIADMYIVAGILLFLLAYVVKLRQSKKESVPAGN